MNGFRFKAKSQGRYGKRHKPGEMNKTEERYASELAIRQEAGEITGWWFEPVRFVLAQLCTFTPDFGILHNDGSMEFVDVKGGGPIQDDSIVKIKAAAEKFWMFQFASEQQQTKKQGGGWKRREF